MTAHILICIAVFFAPILIGVVIYSLICLLSSIDEDIERGELKEGKEKLNTYDD